MMAQCRRNLAADVSSPETLDKAGKRRHACTKNAEVDFSLRPIGNGGEIPRWVCGIEPLRQDCQADGADDRNEQSYEESQSHANALLDRHVERPDLRDGEQEYRKVESDVDAGDRHGLREGIGAFGGMLSVPCSPVARDGVAAEDEGKDDARACGDAQPDEDPARDAEGV